MRKQFIFFISLILIIGISCNDNQKKKEIELKEKELLLKEKEIELKEREFEKNTEIENVTIKVNTDSEKVNTDSDKKSKYQTYCNERFNFCIDYPSKFIPQGESYNGDGQSFMSEDNKTAIVAYGNLAVTDVSDNINKVYNTAIIDDNITYKILKRNYFIISGYDKNGNIFYRKTVSKKINYFGNENTEIFQTLMISYPENQKNVYAEYCQKISKSFKE